LGESVYHLELRHFPRNLCHFNLSGEQLRAAVLEPWAADRPFELGELRWDPRQARLTVLEGPRIPSSQLSMGRGWRTALRQGRDVTAQLLGAAGEALASQAPNPPPGGSEGSGEPDRAAGGPRAADPMADSLDLELLAQVEDHPAPLRRAWELASARAPEAPTSETLAVAERAVAALLGARLIELLDATGPEAAPREATSGAIGEVTPEATAKAIGAQDALQALRAPASWTGPQVWIRRI
jgi:hypothetical protein